MASVACEGVTKSYGTRKALDRVSCEAGHGRVLLVLGPSGAGKTTLLRVVSGLERPESGTVAVGGKTVTGPREFVKPHLRRTAFVFQRPTMWPQLTVLDNVALALHGKGIGKRARRARAAEALDRLDMGDRTGCYPATLSGGELQRAVLARALVTEPEVLLLDEPCASLDIHLRKGLIEAFKRLKSERNATLIWVSHKYEEALGLADKLLLLRNGKSEEYGEPEAVLSHPQSAFSASFLLDANLLRGNVLGKFDRAYSGCDPSALFAVPPDTFALNSNGGLPGTVLASEFRGRHYVYRINVANTELRVRLPNRLEAGQPVSLELTAPPIRLKRS